MYRNGLFLGTFGIKKVNIGQNAIIHMCFEKAARDY